MGVASAWFVAGFLFAGVLFGVVMGVVLWASLTEDPSAVLPPQEAGTADGQPMTSM